MEVRPRRRRSRDYGRDDIRRHHRDVGRRGCDEDWRWGDVFVIGMIPFSIDLTAIQMTGLC